MSKANDKRLDSYLDMPSDLGSRAENKVRSEREQIVQKSNELIRKFRAEMNTPQFKISLYLISKAYTLDNDLEYTFDIKDFCQCCGLDDDSGGNYKRLKREIVSLFFTSPEQEHTATYFKNSPSDERRRLSKLSGTDEGYFYTLAYTNGIQSL